MIYTLCLLLPLQKIICKDSLWRAILIYGYISPILYGRSCPFDYVVDLPLAMHIGMALDTDKALDTVDACKYV